MEHIKGDQWWTDYQAVSYKIQSKRGSRTQFANMVSNCHVHGVKVIVDVIFNHMAGIDGGVGVAGTSFSHFNSYNVRFTDCRIFFWPHFYFPANRTSTIAVGLLLPHHFGDVSYVFRSGLTKGDQIGSFWACTNTSVFFLHADASP